MSLSPAQVQILVNVEPFQTAMRRLVEAVSATAPQIQALTTFLRRLQQDAQRHRARIVTRNKQRRSW